MKNIRLILVILITCITISLQGQVQPSNSEEVYKSFALRQNLIANSIVNQVKFRSIGPTVMSGRVTDVEVDPNNPIHFYVAYASGGLWETRNNGMSFTPIFDNEAVISIGDIAVNWTDSIIWIGTGENNSSRSSYSGLGIYKSTDNGKTWQNMGLLDSHHIGRIVLHPDDPNTLWVATAGHLYSENDERGVFKSIDGGMSWQKTLYVDNKTGAIDMVMDPVNPEILYAAMWQRVRKAWNFTESGEGSGIYKSNDGGQTWSLISTKESGLPYGEGMGRIGLAISSQNSQKIYAFIDNQNHREKTEEGNAEGLTKEQLKKMTKKEFLALDKTLVADYLKKHHFPKKYTVDVVYEMVESGQIYPIALVDYLADANAALFDTPVIGAEVYVSVNGGESWQKTHEDYLDGIYFSYGYYFGQIRVSPFNDDEIYIMGVPILKSIDGGKTFKSISRENVHSDHHALWINPNLKGHLINGNDGGVNISYDDGETWWKANTPAVGQFYSVNYDMETPYNVYGGLQDNSVWFGPSTNKEDLRWQQSGHYDYKSLIGGDGMQVEVDTRDNETIYTGFQFGNYYRLNKNDGNEKSIKPSHNLGEKPLRFNWQTPIKLSLHNQDILYFGSNKFHRSMDQGESFETLSDDLTGGGKQGDVAYGTLTTIDESPMKFGLIYIGTDDGNIYRTADGGYNWEKINDNLPQNLWVSRITASNHNEKIVYASLNGYRNDDFNPYLYRSTDYGKTWKQIGNDLPMEAINVVKEDPINQNILYVGTDHGLYVSLNWGETFMAMNNGLPAVAVHDVAIHPRDKELIVGTHGRSIYIADVSYMQQLVDSILEKDIHVFDPETVNYSKYWGSARWSMWYGYYEPKTKFVFYTSHTDSISYSISDKNNMVLYSDKQKSFDGLNFIEYDLSIDSVIVDAYTASMNENSEEKTELKKADNGKYYLLPGEYILQVKQSTQTIEKSFIVKEKSED